MSHAEIAATYATMYAAASKKDKGRILDRVVELTGWSRDNARRRLTAAAHGPLGSGPCASPRSRTPRAPKFSADALEVLQRVWVASGGQCGKYLAASMRTHLDGLERHGELAFGADHYGPEVREELLAMSAASIDRHLHAVKAEGQRPEESTTKPSPLLRSTVRIRPVDDDAEGEPGLLVGDTVAHCGSTPAGEFAYSVCLADIHTGWVFTRTVRSNAHADVLGALNRAVEEVPFEVVGLDVGNGSELLHTVFVVPGGREVLFARSRHKHDAAVSAARSNHLVRKYGLSLRYDTAEERAVLNLLWKLVDDRLNYLTPTTKPAGYAWTNGGRRRRVYDSPSTPLDRLIAAKVLSSAQRAELTAYRDSLNPAAIGRQIADLQATLADIAGSTSDRLPQLEGSTTRPDIRAMMRIRAADGASRLPAPAAHTVSFDCLGAALP